MLRDRVEQQSLVIGSGPYTLDLTVVGKRAAASVYPDGAKVRYLAILGSSWEHNEGTLNSAVAPPQLSRDRLINSSTGSAINWGSADPKQIIVDAGAELFGPLGGQLITAAVGGTVNAITLSTNIETPVLVDGMTVEFETTGAPTAAVTVGLNALAVKPLLHKSGDQAGAGSWEGAARLRATYDQSLDAWVLMAGHREGSNKGADVASASTLVKPVDARDGSYHRLTGTTSIANLWTGAAPGIEHEFEVVTGFTITNGANLICPSGANIVAAAGDRFRIRHTGSNVWAITGYTRANGKALVETVQPQVVVATYYGEYTTNADLSTVIPFDDTVPTSSEGTQVISIGSVVVTGSQKVRLRAGGWCDAGTGNSRVALAIFRGTTCIQVVSDQGWGSTEPFALSTEVQDIPGAGTYTYSLRIGASAGIVRMNGETTARRYGGASATTLAIEVVN